MNVAITGGSGFIGRRLIKQFLDGKHTVRVLNRHGGTNVPPSVRVFVWDALQGEPPEESLHGADAIVHLAGEPVAQRWTTEAKRKIRESRADGTRRLVHALSTISQRPGVLVCASAIGIYGSRGDEILTESATPGTGFLADVSADWEKQADLARALGMRVVKIRIGVVLDPHGGALQRMLPPFRRFVGGTIGSGRQWMSWIHLDDLAGLFQFVLENPLNGAFNGTAPNPVTNAEFTRTLAATLGRPAVFPVPGVMLKVAFGEMAQVLLSSQRVLPQAAESAGFRFQHPKLGPALANLLK